jgi:hypothetical protein
MDCVTQDIIAEEGLEGPPIHYVTGSIEEIVDIELQPGVLKDPHRPMFIEFHHHIDIAARTSFPPRD